jgi:Hemopexin
MGAKIYFFKDSDYVRYDIAEDKVDDGYPLSIGAFWPGMQGVGFGSGLDTALDGGNGKTYFFKGDRYVRYDLVQDKVDDGYPLSIGQFWPGMQAAGFGSNLDAAMNAGNGKAYFFKGDRYVRYDLPADRVDEGYPLSIGGFWPGMQAVGFGSGLTVAISPNGAGRPHPLTSDLSENFFAALRTACVQLKCHPVRLLLVMYSESRVRASALHPSGGAAGINQMTDASLRGAGWSQGCAAFAQLTAEQQVPYVKRYFEPRVSAGLDSIGRLYQVNFLPATVQPGQGPETVLAERDGVHADAYQENSILDANHDGKITIGDLEATALSLRAQERWQEMEGRL